MLQPAWKGALPTVMSVAAATWEGAVLPKGTRAAVAFLSQKMAAVTLTAATATNCHGFALPGTWWPAAWGAGMKLRRSRRRVVWRVACRMAWHTA